MSAEPLIEKISDHLQNKETPVQNTETPLQNKETPLQNKETLLQNKLKENHEILLLLKETLKDKETPFLIKRKTPVDYEIELEIAKNSKRELIRKQNPDMNDASIELLTEARCQMDVPLLRKQKYKEKQKQAERQKRWEFKCTQEGIKHLENLAKIVQEPFKQKVQLQQKSTFVFNGVKKFMNLCREFKQTGQCKLGDKQCQYVHLPDNKTLQNVVEAWKRQQGVLNQRATKIEEQEVEDQQFL